MLMGCVRTKHLLLLRCMVTGEVGGVKEGIEEGEEVGGVDEEVGELETMDNGQMLRKMIERFCLRSVGMSSQIIVS